MPIRPRAPREAPRPETRPPRLPRGVVLWPLLLLGLIWLLHTYGNNFQAQTEYPTLKEFELALPSPAPAPGKARIDGIVTLDNAKERIEGKILRNDGSPARFRIDFPHEYLTQAKIDEYKVRGLDFRTVNDNSLLQALLLQLLPILLLIATFWFLLARQIRATGGGGGILTFGKSRARLASKERTAITFDDVAGVDEAKEEVGEIIEFLKNPAKFKRLGGRIPRGVMLVGPPGTGKTLLAKAIAGEANVPFFSISGSDFVEMFVGVGASRVRDLFKQAKENSPCIVFLDEIDAVGRKRGYTFGGGHEEREQTLNAILVEMDGFDTDQGIIVIAATNRPDVLDPALLRPGRFDREIVMDLPDLRGREAILRIHARKVKLSPVADLQAIARGTPSYSGADLEAIINEAALKATLAGKEAIEMEDLWEARDKVKWGRQKTSRVMDEEDKRITAYHEGGHALVAKLLPEVEPLHKVTIIPRGMSLGATMQLPVKDKYHMQRRSILGNIKVLYAGRIAEEMFCNDISTGAQNDIERATELAEKMVCEWGMSDRIGPMTVSREDSRSTALGDLPLSKRLSEDTAVAVDEEVRRILKECYEETRRLLENHRATIETIAAALLKHEVLEGTDIDKVLAGEPIGKEPKAAPAAPAPPPLTPRPEPGTSAGPALAPSPA